LWVTSTTYTDYKTKYGGTSSFEFKSGGIESDVEGDSKNNGGLFIERYWQK
jgi:hypothetical protein